SVQAIRNLHDAHDGDGELAVLREVLRPRLRDLRVTVLQHLGEDVRVEERAAHITGRVRQFLRRSRTCSMASSTTSGSSANKPSKLFSPLAPFFGASSTSTITSAGPTGTSSGNRDMWSATISTLSLIAMYFAIHVTLHAYQFHYVMHIQRANR